MKFLFIHDSFKLESSVDRALTEFAHECIGSLAALSVEIPSADDFQYPQTTPVYVLNPKQDLHGLGFDPFKHAPEFRERKRSHAYLMVETEAEIVTAGGLIHQR